VMMLVTASLLFGVVAAAAEPWLGDIITDGQFEISPVAVLGWSIYAAASSVVMLYGGLAAVRHRHATVMTTRIVEATLSVAIVGLLLLLSIDVSWSPVALALGAALSGGAVRRWVLRPLAEEEDTAEPESVDTLQDVIVSTGASGSP